MFVSNVPPPGNRVPSESGPSAVALSRLALRAIGWQVAGKPPDLSKFIIAIAPHTSYFDWPILMLAMYSIPMKASWMGKHTIFRFPFGSLLERLGGIPIDRRAHHGIVETMVHEFETRDALVLGITPEGTRKKVERWKTGFYHMASKAGVPIVLLYLDYPSRTVGFGPALTPSGDLGLDLQAMKRFFSNYRGRNPDQF
jgi:1-acyl-sn-glycerol-3-phosphate acyltransferase